MSATANAVSIPLIEKRVAKGDRENNRPAKPPSRRSWKNLAPSSQRAATVAASETAEIQWEAISGEIFKTNLNRASMRVNKGVVVPNTRSPSLYTKPTPRAMCSAYRKVIYASSPITAGRYRR
jgi:hypothetical protein